MRQSVAALALIRSRKEGHTLWLARWNRHWQSYSFVGGHEHPEESFRECVVREVGEELGLSEGTGFAVASQPQAHLEYTAWSESAQAETAYVIEIFDVELLGTAARDAVDADPQNRWVTEAEIRSQRSADGEPISATMERLLSMAGLLPECQGS